MKIRLLTAMCVLAISLASTSPCAAVDDMDMAADVLIVRPACLIATVAGSTLFVLSLPFAWTSRSVHKAAKIFVVLPAEATFTRPLGDMHALEN